MAGRRANLPDRTENPLAIIELEETWAMKTTGVDSQQRILYYGWKTFCVHIFNKKIV
jgi:hypothetical protein